MTSGAGKVGSKPVRRKNSRRDDVRAFGEIVAQVTFREKVREERWHAGAPWDAFGHEPTSAALEGEASESDASGHLYTPAKAKSWRSPRGG